jgi:DNA repair protein RadA/Sms
MMAKAKVHYECEACGYQSPTKLGKCPECNAWGTLEAVQIAAATPTSLGAATASFFTAVAPPNTPVGATLASTIPKGLLDGPSLAVALDDIAAQETDRTPTGLGELDRVLGGGLIRDAFILIGGEPGIGKSTLSLQMAGVLSQRLASEDAPDATRVLYVCAEESAAQVKGRASRLGVQGAGLRIAPLTQLDQIVIEALRLRPRVLIVDSIQAIFAPEINGAPGGPSQVKACAMKLQQLCKQEGLCVFMIGHVTKEGSLAGPKQLEHLVDTVLTFEGDRYQDLRLLRTVKNRFGATQELGLFEMRESGLHEVPNPSERFLSGSLTESLPGCVTTCTVEGNRLLLVELQALVGQSAYHYPKRMVNGLETNRIHQIVAVLERKLGLDFSRHDVYVNAVGGLDIREPAADLAIALALVSSLQNVPVYPKTMIVGEVGLTGEIRPVSKLGDRVKEAGHLGFQLVVAPQGREEDARTGDPQQATCRTIFDAVRHALNKQAAEVTRHGNPAQTDEG